MTISDHGTGERGRWFYNKEGKLEKAPPKRELRPIHAVIQDTRMKPIECMCGCDRIFDSMTQYKRHLKEGGWEITGEIPKGPETRRATEVLDELVNRDTMNEDWEKAKALADNGMLPMSADERARLEAYKNDKEAQERAWRQRNWHLK